AGAINVDGTMQIQGNGSLGATGAITVNYDATLRIDDSGVRNSDRIADATPILLRGGRLLYSVGGQGSTPSTETIGNVTLVEGTSTLSAGSNSSPTSLTINQVNRQLGSTLLESGIVFLGNGASLNANGILPWIGNSTPALVFSSSISGVIGSYNGPKP